MTLTQAQESLLALEVREEWTLETAQKAFSLSLAIFDKQKAEYFYEKYIDLVYELFMNTILHCNQDRCIEVFTQFKEVWDTIFYFDTRLLYIAMMQKKNMLNNQTLQNLIIEDYIELHNKPNEFKRIMEYLQKNHTLDMSIEMLQSKLLSNINSSKISAKLLRHCWETILHCSDIEYILKLSENPHISKSYRMTLIVHAANILAKTNLEEAIELLSQIEPRQYSYELEKCYYTIACDYAKNNEFQKASEIIKLIKDTQYQYGFRALNEALQYDIVAIEKTLQEIETLHQTQFLDEDKYDAIIICVANAIVDFAPELTQKVLLALHQHWIDILELQENITVSLAQKDLDKALCYIDEVEIDDYKVNALKRILVDKNDAFSIEKMIQKVHTFESPVARYEFFYELQTVYKVNLFEQIYGVTQLIKPYDEISLYSKKQ